MGDNVLILKGGYFYEIELVINRNIEEKMSPTLTIVVVVAVLLISVGFLLLVFILIPAINQLRFFLHDLEKTSTEVRNLTLKLTDLTEKVGQDAEKVRNILDSSEKIVDNVTRSVKFINTNVFKRAGFLAILPAIKLGWKFIKKAKGGK